MPSAPETPTPGPPVAAIISASVAITVVTKPENVLAESS